VGGKGCKGGKGGADRKGRKGRRGRGGRNFVKAPTSYFSYGPKTPLAATILGNSLPRYLCYLSYLWGRERLQRRGRRGGQER